MHPPPSSLPWMYLPMTSSKSMNESAADLLFMNMNWARSLPAFTSLSLRDQVSQLVTPLTLLVVLLSERPPCELLSATAYYKTNENVPRDLDTSQDEALDSVTVATMKWKKNLRNLLASDKTLSTYTVCVIHNYCILKGQKIHQSNCLVIQTFIPNQTASSSIEEKKTFNFLVYYALP